MTLGYWHDLYRECFPNSHIVHPQENTTGVGEVFVPEASTVKRSRDLDKLAMQSTSCGLPVYQQSFHPNGFISPTKQTNTSLKPSVNILRSFSQERERSLDMLSSMTATISSEDMKESV